MSKEILDITKEIISIKSTSYHELEVASYISSLLHKENIPHVFDEFNPRDYTNSKLTDLPKTANIYVELGSGNETLMLYAHTDVVDAKQDLFKPFVKDGKLYGRGASDMKSSVAGLLHFLLNNYEKIKNSNKKIIFWFIADEETSATGIKRCVEWLKSKNINNISCILMEPTDNFTKLENGGKGYCFLDIEGDMSDIIASFKRIKQSKDQILAKYPDKMDGFNTPTAELTKISCSEIIKDANIKFVEGKPNHASRPYENGAINALELVIKQNENISYIITSDSEGPNTLPGKAFFITNDSKYNNLYCKAHIDIRTNLAADKKDALIQDITNFISKNLKISIRDRGKAFKTTDEQLIALCEKATGQKIKILLATGGSDAPYLLELTDKIVIFGPGTKKVIHTEGEFIEITALEKTPQIIKNIVNEYLQGGIK